MNHTITCTNAQPLTASNRRPRSIFMNWLRVIQLSNHGAASDRASHDASASKSFKIRMLNELDELNTEV